VVKSNQIVEGMVARSKRKGFDPPEWSAAEVREVIDGGRCSKTGIAFEFDQSRWSKSPWTPVPDRIDPSEGYTKANTQWVCHMYNCMKWEYGEAEVDIFVDALIAARLQPGGF